MVLILGISILFIPVKAASYKVVISVEKNDEKIWENIYWLEVNDENATILIPKWVYDKFFDLIDNRTFTTPFWLAIVNINAKTVFQLDATSHPSGLKVTLKATYLGDVNFDGKVEYYDLYLFGLACG
jgi:hypothetical protein